MDYLRPDFRDGSTRDVSTNAAGETPVSFLNTRENVRSDMAARLAKLGRLRLPHGSALSSAIRVRNRLVALICTDRAALYWVCPPARRKNRTRFRAIARATSAPRSASTSVRQRSMPAVTPAEV